MFNIHFFLVKKTNRMHFPLVFFLEIMEFYIILNLHIQASSSQKQMAIAMPSTQNFSIKQLGRMW